jgi:4-amino-4-deoxy-L-arabinose transferase-like glycosyltransferase
LSGFSSGSAGVFRVFNGELGGQIGWVVPLAIGGLVMVVLAAWTRRDRRLWALAVVFGGWFAVGIAAYSITKGIVHPYYFAGVAPAAAALIGLGAAAVGETAGSPAQRRLLFVAGTVVLGSATGEWLLAQQSDYQPARVAAIVAALGAPAIVGGVWARGRQVDHLFGAAAIGLLLVPGVWTVTSLKAGVSPMLPYASPARSGGALVGAGLPAGLFDELGDLPAGGLPGGLGGPGGSGAPGGVGVPGLPGGLGDLPGGLPGGLGALSGGPGGFGALTDDQTQALVAYLSAQRHGERWVLAVPSSMTASPIIIESGLPVMALGGFSGSDRILTTDQFAAKVAAHQVRYLMTTGSLPGFAAPAGTPSGGPGAGAPGGADWSGYAARHCTAVDAAVWQGSGAAGSPFAPVLYDCRP